MALGEYGENLELDENASGQPVLRNTNTGVEVTLSTAIELSGALTAGSATVGGVPYTEKADLTGPDGVLVSAQVPNLAITQTFTVADEDERLALDVEEGDVAIETDNKTTYIFTGGDPSVNANWSVIEFDLLGAIDGQPINPSSVSIADDTIAQGVVASGTVTLSDGVATVDTGVSDTDATFQLALGANTNDAKVAGRLFLDSSDGQYKVEIVEDETLVGDPSVDYDVVRVR